MPDLLNLSRREREILEIVFSLGETTLTEILEHVDNPPTRPALRSIIGILEAKGKLIQGKKRGREFTFRPVESRKRVGKSALTRVLDTFFSGSLGDAVATHLNDPRAKFSDEELAELAALIESKRSQSK
ncbi:MAG: BlaI/MecI/CopY family transcriptional regulator [Akkermansiaceae bacterium]|jgi:predicted transcriptional regulator